MKNILWKIWLTICWIAIFIVALAFGTLWLTFSIVDDYIVTPMRQIIRIALNIITTIRLFLDEAIKYIMRRCGYGDEIPEDYNFIRSALSDTNVNIDEAVNEL